MGRYNFNQRTRDGYEISPEQAAKWLERNDNNRNVNVAKVKKMAKDMREGHWDTTHQGIAIATGQRVAKRVNNGDFPYNVYDANGGIVKPETKKTKKAV